jgi:hypothetical protein
LASWGDRELAVERTAEGRSGAGTLRRRDVAPIQRHELIEIREGEVARARPLGRQGDDGQLEPIDQSKAESWIPAGGQSRRRTEGAGAPNQATGGRQGRGYRFGDRGAEKEGGNQKLVCRGRAWLQGITCMDFITAAWVSSVGCWGTHSRLPLTHTCANPTTKHQKKPRQGSGAREIRDIRTISAMKPLQTLKGSN